MEIKLTRKVHKVHIIESERGWGSKVDEVKYFETKEEAEAFINNYNKSNNLRVVPDWYMYAEYGGVHVC